MYRNTYYALQSPLPFASVTHYQMQRSHISCRVLAFPWWGVSLTFTSQVATGDHEPVKMHWNFFLAKSPVPQALERWRRRGSRSVAGSSSTVSTHARRQADRQAD